MLTPRLAASLTIVVGLSMLAGWVTAFRNRAYLGWLGLAFLAVSGYLLAVDRVRVAQEMGLAHAGAAVAATAFLVVCIVAFLLAVVAAAQETVRRIREIREGHRAAEEALLAMMQGNLEREEQAERKPEAGDDVSGPKNGRP